MESSGKTPVQPIFYCKKKKSLLQTVHRAYIMPMIRKITKTSKPQLLHQGYYRKNCKKRVKRGVKCQMGQKLESKISHSGAKFSHSGAKMLPPTALLLSLLFFCSIFPSDLLSAMISSTRILRAWINSTKLA